MKKLAFIVLLVSGCDFGLSASASIPSVTAYCQPINVDEQACREDDGATWLCLVHAGAWDCEMTAPHGAYWNHWYVGPHWHRERLRF